MKRLFDVLVATVGLLAASPLLLLVAIAVALERGGPVLFRQERVGLHGNCFQILKFRTMSVGGGGPAVTSSGDSRITRVGHYLRQTKIDELPQLINVVKGEMSLVGPRPEVPQYVAKWPTSARDEILRVRPGITDPATVANRRESEELAASEDPERYYEEVLLPRKVAVYIEYVRGRSLMGDARIIAQTLWAIVAK